MKAKENSIKEDIILLKDFTEGNFKSDRLENYKGSYKMGYFYYKDIQQAIEHVLSDYTRLLKEKEKNKKAIDFINQRKKIVNKDMTEGTRLQVGTFMWQVDELLEILKEE